MRRTTWTTLLAITAFVGGCGGGEQAPSGEVAAWSLASGIGEIGNGVPFCDAVMPRVAEYMGQFEGQLSPDDRYGGTAVVAAIGELAGGMNGHVSSGQEATDHQNSINLMTLIRYDADLEPLPYLAESWDVSDDFSQITFHIRDDVYWHDGERTDAYDVAYTFRRAIDPETGFPNTGYFTYYDQTPDGVQVVDSLTVTFRMQPHADFIDPWRQTTIMPEHLLADVPAAELRQHPFGTICPVGNGPFLFVQHREGASWTFQANPAFPEALGGRPFLDRYIYRIIPDQTTILTELLTENVDVHIAPDPDQAQAIIDSEALELLAYPARQFVFVAWNARRPQLADKRVRLAITKATNREEIVDAFFLGYARVTNNTLPPIHWAYDSSIGAEATAYDPDAARALLEEAGWIDRDGDGVRENAEGVRLAISLKYNEGNELRGGIAEVMQSQLAEVGIEATPIVMEFTTLLGQILDPDVRDYDGWVIGFTGDFRSDDSSLFHSGQIDGQNAFAGTRRPDIDRYLDRLPLILDREEAIGVWREYLALLVDEQPYTFLYVSDRLDGVNRRLQNVVMDARGEYQNVKDWWIPADQRRGRGR